MTDLASLVERIERAEGPDWRLDAEIACEALGWSQHVIGGAPHAAVVWRQGAAQWPAAERGPPPYTASLDAAMSLIPEGWKTVGAEQGSDGWMWVLRRDGPHVTTAFAVGNAKTAPLSITAAALKAIAALRAIAEKKET